MLGRVTLYVANKNYMGAFSWRSIAKLLHSTFMCAKFKQHQSLRSPRNVGSYLRE